MNISPLIYLIISIALFFIIYRTCRKSSTWVLLVILSVLLQIEAIWVFKLELLSWVNLIFWFLFLVTLILLFISKKWYRWYRRITKLNSIWALGIIIVLFIGQVFYPHSPSTQTPLPTATSGPTSQHITWKMSEDAPKDSSWIYKGLAEIRGAKTAKEAEKATKLWVDIIKHNTIKLSGAIWYFTDQEQDIQPKDLVKDGWATDLAVKWATRIELAIADSTIVSYMIPAGWWNSGIINGKVVPTSKIKKPIKGVLIRNNSTGKELALVGICGNIATPDYPKPKPKPKPVPTPTPKVTPRPTPTPCVTLKPKNNSGGSHSNGDSDHGGGSIIIGHGTPIPPDPKDDPPTGARINPTPKIISIPEPTGTPQPGVTTQKPTPLPSPPPRETMAPPPDDPATGRV